MWLKKLDHGAYSPVAQVWVGGAQDLSDRSQHRETLVLHMGASLLELDEARAVLRAAGADPETCARACEQKLARAPRSSGKLGQVSPELLMVLRRAERAAFGGGCVSPRHLLDALAGSDLDDPFAALLRAPAAIEALAAWLDAIEPGSGFVTLEGFDVLAGRLLVRAQELADQTDRAEVTPLHLGVVLLEASFASESVRARGFDPEVLARKAREACERLPRRVGEKPTFGLRSFALLRRARQLAGEGAAVGALDLLSAMAQETGPALVEAFEWMKVRDPRA